MTMTDNEICRNYREAKNRPEQIKLLADMNCTTVDEIKKILVAKGELVVAPPKTNRGKKPQEKPKQAEENPKTVAIPDAVMETLAAELDALDMQISLTKAKLEPLVDRYNEISAFIKSYRSV